jgi:hypothetical protein
MSDHPGRWILSVALLLAAIGSVPLAATAETKTGVGNFHRPFVSRLEVFEPLRRHDPDAVRISEFQSYTSAAWTAELYPDAKRPGFATAHIAFFDDRYGTQAGWLWLNLRLSDYHDLAARVDDAVAESRLPPAKDAEIIVWADAPSYLVERRKNGVTTWFEESGDDAIATDLVEQLVNKLPFPLCWYVTLRNPASGAALDACQKVEPPGVHHEEGEATEGPADAKPTP